MNVKSIMNGVTGAFYKVGFQLKKHSPEILVVAGTAGVVASTVLACKATLKVNEVLEPAKETIDIIHKATEEGKTEGGVEYTPEDGKKDLTIVYTQTGLQLVKLYAPAVITGLLGIGAIITSHGIMRSRTAALAAAYTAVDRSFKNYRGRVIDRFGEELDRELKYNIKTKEVEEVVTNEDGTESVVKKTVEVMDLDRPNDYSPYAVFFDEACPGWSKDPEQSKFFLLQQERFANEKLQAQGYIFLNDVYEMIGVPKTKIGQRIGWVYDKNNPVGDNYVDFGIFDGRREKVRDFVNGYERVIILDFNVDGYIDDIFA